MKNDVLDELVTKYNGYLLTVEAQKADISRTYLQKYVTKNRFKRVERGIYLAPGKVVDPLYILQLKNAGIVYSHDTALYLHSFIEKKPVKIEVTVKRGYNATHLRNKGIKPYCVNKEQFESGITNIRTAEGNLVNVYNEDKTICDTIRRKDEMDCQNFQDVLKKYMRSTNKDIGRLLGYAKIEGIEKKAKDYIGLMTDL